MGVRNGGGEGRWGGDARRGGGGVKGQLRCKGQLRWQAQANMVPYGVSSERCQGLRAGYIRLSCPQPNPLPDPSD